MAHSTLLTPLSHIGCLKCLSIYKKEDVRICYLKCWKKTHADSQSKSEGDSIFMESFGYAFKNIVEAVKPLINPQKNPIKFLDWQVIWNVIIGIETRIMSGSIESNVLQNYIYMLEEAKPGKHGEKFPIGYFESLQTYLDQVKEKEQSYLNEVSLEIESKEEETSPPLEPQTLEDKDSNEVATINLDEDSNEVVCINLDESLDCEAEDSNEVISINLDESLEDFEEDTNNDCEQNMEFNFTNKSKKRKRENSLEDAHERSFEDEGLENNIDSDIGQMKEDRSDYEEDLNNGDKNRNEIKKRPYISWKNIKKNAEDKGHSRNVSKIDENTLKDGCFIVVNQSVKLTEITNTRNWGKGSNLHWKNVKSALGYNCHGSKVCENDECQYFLNAKYFKTIENKRNIYYWTKLNGEEVCEYCESSIISDVSCDARLLIVTTNAGNKEIYQSGSHCCFKKRIHSKLPEDFKEKLESDELTPRETEDKEIMNLIKMGKTKQEIISEASKFISSGKSGSIRKYNQVTKNLGSKEEQILEAQRKFSKLDSLIIEHVLFSSKEPKFFGTSEEMLELALSMDEDLVDNNMEYVHQDGVHSYLREGKMLAIYAVHPLLNSIVRLAWVFTHIENAENMGFLWINFNRVFSERKKKCLAEKKKVQGDLKFKPYGIMADCHGANPNGLIIAGYDPEWVKKVLRNCLSHFKMRVELRQKDVVKSHGNAKSKEFERLSWKWQTSATDEGAQVNFEEWRLFCENIGLGNFCRWWNNQRLFVVQAFRGVYTPKSNLSECYQSGLSKGLSLVQALNNQGIASVRIGILLSSLSEGSRNIKGQTPSTTEKRLIKEHNDALFASQVSDELNNVILIMDEPGCSNTQTKQVIPNEEQKCGPFSNGNRWGRKPNHRTKMNTNAENSLKLVSTFNWTVLEIIEKKTFKLRRGNMTPTVNISNYPSCTCSFWNKTNQSSDQTCADIMYILKELFQVSDEDELIYQVMFKPGELKLLRSQYKPPKEKTPEWGRMTDSELKILFKKASSIEPVWKLGKTKANSTAKCRGCSRVLDRNEVVIFVDGLSLIRKTMKPIPNRFNFCLNSDCAKKLPYTNLPEPGIFKLDYRDGHSVLTNDEITRALDIVSTIDMED